MEPFIDHVDKHIIPLLGKNTNDRLLNVIAISHYITKSFKNEHGQTLSAEDIGILMGSDDYKDMDYSKATHVIKNVFIVSASAVNYRHEQKNLPKRYQSRAICASPPLLESARKRTAPRQVDLYDVSCHSLSATHWLLLARFAGRFPQMAHRAFLLPEMD